LDRCSHQPGAKLLWPFVAQPKGPTRSEFEDAFLAFIRRYALPTPLVNIRLNGYEVDALFPAHKLIVELDSWGFHGDRTAFATDRERDAHALLHGYATIRITWERLRDAPDREAARLREILSARR
jgi:very-short-patch-repair endonuclease